MGDIDWGAWIRADRDNINRDRGGTPAADTSEETMSRPKNTDIREWWHEPVRDLTASQRKQAMGLWIREHAGDAPNPLLRLLDDNPNMSIIKAATTLATVTGHERDTNGTRTGHSVQNSVPDTSTAAVPSRWQPGMLVDELPADLHRARVAVSDAQRTATAAREHPGQWAVYSVHTGAHARRVALDKARRASGAKAAAFRPAGSFEARAIEAEPGRYVVFARYVGGR